MYMTVFAMFCVGGWGGWFSPPSTWVQEVKLWLPGLVISILTSLATSPAPS